MKKQEKKLLRKAWNYIRTLYDDPGKNEKEILSASLRIALLEIGFRQHKIIKPYMGMKEIKRKADVGWRKAAQFLPIIVKMSKEGRVENQKEAEVLRLIVEMVRVELAAREERKKNDK